MMNNFVSDAITWPPEEKGGAGGEGPQAPLSEEALKRKRIEDSKYEDSSSSHP